MITKPKKKLTLNSIVSQKARSNPKNKKRQEGFLPVDLAYLNSNPSIEAGKSIGFGDKANVFEVKGNRNLVMKVPKGNDSWLRDLVDEEGDQFNRFGLHNEPLFIPTKVIYVGDDEDSYPILVRPKVAPITDYTGKVKPQNLKRVTKSLLEAIRRKLIDLSWKGFAIHDGLQLGLDKAGRPLLYDFGGLEKFAPSDKMAFKVNNEQWFYFLRKVTNKVICESDMVTYGYGTVNANERY